MTVSSLVVSLLLLCLQVFVKACTDLLGGVGTHWSDAIEDLVQECLAINHAR